MKERAFSWKTEDDLAIYAKEWAVSTPSFVIGLVHGLGEHINRYSHLASYFNQRHGVVIGYDQRGHGQSGGKRGHTPSYDMMMEEVAHLLVEAETQYPNLPVFLYGHSMGGALVMNYCLSRHPNVKGLIATGPWIQLAFQPPAVKVALGRAVNPLLPKLSQPSGLDPALVSTDEEVVRRYKEDPLVHDKITVRAGNEFMDAGQRLHDFQGEFPLPFLLMHGEADGVTSCDASRQFAERVEGEVTFKSWPGMAHEIHNEPEHKKVFDYTWEWMRKIMR